MLPTERMYSYTQSSQLIAQTGCIGHLRGDMEWDGDSFFTSWDDHRGDLKTDEFKAEFDRLINTLRSDNAFGAVLKTAKRLPAMVTSILKVRSRMIMIPITVFA